MTVTESIVEQRGRIGRAAWHYSLDRRSVHRVVESKGNAFGCTRKGVAFALRAGALAGTMIKAGTTLIILFR